MRKTLMSVARRPAVHKILSDDSVSDAEAATRIEALTGAEVSESDIRSYRRLTSASFLRASPYPDGDSPLPAVPAPVRPKTTIPEWAGTPGYEVDENEGTIYTKPRLVTSADAGVADDAAELREFGFDPEIWEVAWAKRSNWQAPNGDWLESRKLTVRKRDSHRLKLENVNEVFAAYVTPEANPRTTKERTVVIALGDLQAGKVQSGGGSESLVVRFARINSEIAAYLRDTGGCERLIICLAGDCIEGVVSQGGRLITMLDLSVTEQVRLVTRMIQHQVGVFAPLADKVLFMAVPGNHDESHRIAATRASDSWAIQAASAVGDSLRMLDGYDHVQWLFPEDNELVRTVSVGTEEHPYVIALSHGHKPGKAAQMMRWWSDQAMGRRPAGEADLLITGHLHHLRVEQGGYGRTWIQLPAMDGGSDWYRDLRGDNLPAGIVTMEIDPARAPGWHDLRMWT